MHVIFAILCVLEMTLMRDADRGEQHNAMSRGNQSF
jgi:hypothetical protein